MARISVPEALQSPSAKQHFGLNSVASNVFASVHGKDNANANAEDQGYGGRRRWSIEQLVTDLAFAKAEVERQREQEKERRQSEAKLAAAMLDPKLVEEQVENLTSSLAETAALLEELMGMKVVLQDIEHSLPKDLLKAFSTGVFIEQCNERYDELATTAASSEEGLTPDELFPVILEMTQNAPWEITWEQCVKFADIFDADGNGTRKDG